MRKFLFKSSTISNIYSKFLSSDDPTNSNSPKVKRWRTRSQFPDEAAIDSGVLPSQFLELMLHP